MATRKVGARVELDGEREYKQALAELNTGNRTLATEMKKLQAEFRGQENSTEALTKKGELLERQLLQQHDKVEKLREAVANAAKQYGESSDTTQKYVQQLNMAETAEFDLQHAIEDNNAAMRGEQDTMIGLGDAVSSLTEKLGVRLPDGAKKALNGMQNLSTGTVAAMGAAVAAVAALAEAIKALHENAVEYAAEADDLMSRSLVTGLSTTLLQELQYAEPLIDVSVDTITGSMTKLTNNMASAADGNKEMAAAFQDLGVSITDADGQLRSAQDVFFDVVDALGGIGNETERDAAAMALMGKSAQELNPLIKQGTDTLHEYLDAAHENFVLTEDQIEALGELDDQVQKNNLAWEGLKKQIAAQFAPASKEALESFGNLVTAAGKALVDSGIIKGVGEIFSTLSHLMDPLTDLLNTSETVPGRLGPVYTVLHAIAGVIAWIADAANVVVGLLSGDFNKIGTALGFGAKYGNYSNLQKWQGMGDMTGNSYDPNTGLYSGNWAGNAGGTENWRGGLTWVGENGPEVAALPQGTQIYSNQESRSLGGDTFYITIDAKNVEEFNQVVEMARNARVKARMR